jgi:hypothetical protein
VMALLLLGPGRQAGGCTASATGRSTRTAAAAAATTLPSRGRWSRHHRCCTAAPPSHVVRHRRHQPPSSRAPLLPRCRGHGNIHQNPCRTVSWLRWRRPAAAAAAASAPSTNNGGAADKQAADVGGGGRRGRAEVGLPITPELEEGCIAACERKVAAAVAHHRATGERFVDRDFDVEDAEEGWRCVYAHAKRWASLLLPPPPLPP